MVTITTALMNVVNKGVAVAVVEVTEQCSYNNIMVTKKIVRWCQVEAEIQSMPNVIDVSNGEILHSIAQITTTMKNTKDKYVVKWHNFVSRQCCF